MKVKKRTAGRLQSMLLALALLLALAAPAAAAEPGNALSLRSTDGGTPGTDAILNGTAAGYRDRGDDPWIIMGMSAYRRAFGAAGTSAGAAQEFIDGAAERASAGAPAGQYAKDILALRALGKDPARLTDRSGAEADIPRKLLETDWTGISSYDAPYVLLAVRQGDWGAEADRISALFSVLRDAAGGDFLFSYTWDGVTFPSPDAAGAALAAAAPYAADAEDPYGVRAEAGALCAGILDALADSSLRNGSGSYGSANTDAMVILGLCAAGVDPAADSRFRSGGVSLLDGLLSYACPEGDGFGYTDRTRNGLATEQGFRALLAARQAALNGGRYSFYDFTGEPAEPAAATRYLGCPVTVRTVPEGASVQMARMTGEKVAPVYGDRYDLVPGNYRCTVSMEGRTGRTELVTVGRDDAGYAPRTLEFSLAPAAEEQKSVSVSVRAAVPPEDRSRAYLYRWDAASYRDLMTDRTPLSLPAGSTARDALTAALDRSGIEYTEQSDGYFPMIGGLSNTDRGPASGWLYMVNGAAAQVSCSEFLLRDGDSVTWFFTDDYGRDYGSESWDPAGIYAEASVLENADGSFTAAPPDGWDRTKPLRAVLPRVRPGQTAVLLRGDGSWEIVRKSAEVEGGMYLVLPGGGQIRLLDCRALYPDVGEGDWFARAVDFVSGREILNGTDRGFAPDELMSRAMAAAALMNLERGTPGGACGFTDVEPGSWYAGCVAWAAERGYVSGVGGGRFEPERMLTREELAVMLRNYMTAQGGHAAAARQGVLDRFRDRDTAAGWAEDALAWAVETGIMAGSPDGLLTPAEPVTRAEAASMLRNAVSVLLRS